MFPAEEGCGLGKVAARLGIRFEHHDAGEDAYACAEIALAAARQTGAPSIAALSRAIHLPITTLSAGPDVAARSQSRPGSLTERARRAALDRPSAPPGLHFAVRGSSGNRYAVTLEDRALGPRLRCTCMAGRYGTLCRHVKALMAGDITDLLSGNYADVEALRLRMIARGWVEPYSAAARVSPGTVMPMSRRSSASASVSLLAVVSRRSP